MNSKKADEIVCLQFVKIHLLRCLDLGIQHFREDLSDFLCILMMIGNGNYQRLHLAIPT